MNSEAINAAIRLLAMQSTLDQVDNDIRLVCETVLELMTCRVEATPATITYYGSDGEVQKQIAISSGAEVKTLGD